MDIVLQTFNLTKVYKEKIAVNNVNMTVKKGDIYGFVGLNGAGKTTLIRLITGLIRKNAGSFSLFGFSENKTIVKARRRVSCMVETPTLYLDLSGTDNLKIQCDLLQMPPVIIPELLNLVGLDPFLRKKAKDYSLGMKQRLAIAMALVGDPEFLLLDEPTNGLDPEGIVEIRTLLQRLNAEHGITILISSHILSELSKLATTYGFIHNGVLLKEISAAEIEASVGKKLALEVDNLPKAVELIKDKHTFTVNNNILEISDADNPSNIMHLFDQNGITVSSFNILKGDLEQYFLNLIKKGGN